MVLIYMNASFVPRLLGFHEPSRDELLYEIMSRNPWLGTPPAPPAADPDVSALVTPIMISEPKDSECKRVIEELAIPQETKEVLCRYVGIKRGIAMEDSALDMFSNSIGCEIRRGTGLFKKDLVRVDLGAGRRGVRVVVGGRVDGLTDDTVIETKNRRDRLFGFVPEYERIQVQIYMFLTGRTKCVHLENFDGTQNVAAVDCDPTALEKIRSGVASKLVELLGRD